MSDGFSLIEMLVSTMILVIAAMGAVAFFSTPPEYRIAKDFAAIQYGYAILADAQMQHLKNPGFFAGKTNFAYDAVNGMNNPSTNANRLPFFTGIATNYYTLLYTSSPPAFVLSLYRSAATNNQQFIRVITNRL